MTQKFKELEKHYKVDMGKKPLDVEISLLTDYIGDIFAAINSLMYKKASPRIGGNSTVEECDAFGFPANAIELAFQR
uniref:Uncharacterized protein n=1 Tax=Panagrolaimus sp. ES5 TaxID=591445 RepID=A0AC34G4D0_9BILA